MTKRVGQRLVTRFPMVAILATYKMAQMSHSSLSTLKVWFHTAGTATQQRLVIFLYPLTLCVTLVSILQFSQFISLINLKCNVAVNGGVVAKIAKNFPAQILMLSLWIEHSLEIYRQLIIQVNRCNIMAYYDISSSTESVGGQYAGKRHR